MSNVKATNNNKIQHSPQYFAIRKETENWPAWKVAAYNASIANSPYAKKIGVKVN